MGRRRRQSQHAVNAPRWVERVAIAALAALATGGGTKGAATTALTIFLVVVAIEELGKRWTWHGRRVTLRDVALGSVGDLRLLLRKRRRGRKKRRRRSKARTLASRAASAARDSHGGQVSE